MNLSFVLDDVEGDGVLAWPQRLRTASFVVLLGILAWAPFPLGSNREWSWGVLSALVGLCWALWSFWAIASLPTQKENLRKLSVPIVCVAGTLIWALVQVCTLVPQSWVHPIWLLAANILEHPVSGVISLNPWRTISEISKLLTELAVVWLTFSLTKDSKRARYLLDTLIFVAASYAAYGFLLGLFGTTQYALYYPEPTLFVVLPAGPFVLHNSFATYEGLAALAAIARLVDMARDRILTSKGIRRCILTALQFIFGSGIPIVLATILTISALVASASRGGVFSTLCGMMVMTILAISISKRERRLWAFGGACGLFLIIGGLFWISGNTLGARVEDLLDAGNADAIRLALWDAGQRMIASSPLLGLGLGTFEDAYPMYARQTLPFVMDAAHCDYLEFAAGVGLPAAISWWFAMLWCAATMVRGIFTRRRNTIFPLIGVGATVLVAVHSSVDFSLQIPAVATFYAALLGIGLSQSFATRSAR